MTDPYRAADPFTTQPTTYFSFPVASDRDRLAAIIYLLETANDSERIHETLTKWFEGA